MLPYCTKFHMKVTKCTIDLTSCDYYDTFRIHDFCDKLAAKNAIWTPTVNTIVPPILCPLTQVIRPLIFFKI